MSSWKLVSTDHTLALNLDANDENGALNGSLIYEGTRYPVTGAWAASGSIGGRNASAFARSGRTQTMPDVPSFLAAAGIMTGPGASPTRVDIQVDSSSSADGGFRHYQGVLLPA